LTFLKIYGIINYKRKGQNFMKENRDFHLEQAKAALHSVVSFCQDFKAELAKNNPILDKLLDDIEKEIKNVR